MSLADAFASSDANHKNKVLISMFGHLHPEWEKEYPIVVTFTHAYYNGFVIIDMETEVEDSPWFAGHVNDLVGGHVRRSAKGRGDQHWYVRNMRLVQGRIYSFIGTYRVRKNGRPVFTGKVVARTLNTIKTKPIPE